MTEIKEVVDMITNPVDPAEWKARPIPANFPIKVNEDTSTVTVAAGIPQRVLLDYLAEYRHWKQPNGWSLPAYSWFIDQTMGGAVATGTHGSSMRYGSLSSQMVGLKLLTANSTIIEITPKKNEHLWKAAGVSVGRLGVITELTFKIRPQMAVTRKLQEISYSEFAQQVKEVQDEYNRAKAAGDTDAMRYAAAKLDETQTFLNFPLGSAWRNDFIWHDKEPLGVLLNIDQTPSVQAMNGPSVYEQIDRNPVGPNGQLTRNTRYWANFYSTFLRGYVNPGTFESRRAFHSQTEFTTRSATMAPYNQLEVCIPLSVAGSCLHEVGAELYGPETLWDGYRTPNLVRFTSGEEYYLSNSRDEPHMWINMEDYISLSSGKPNDKFNKAIQLFIDRCGAKLHWGKWGWDQFNKCYDGAAQYGKEWCDFGCAANQLDPTGKFNGGWDGWNFRAMKDGKEVPFGSCCTANGFNSAQCQCASSKPSNC
jgi:FAD/FMN-containing dehydrogenase